MDLGFTIDRNDLPVNDGGFEPLPAGTYDIVIDGVELKTTKDGTGQYLNLKMKVISESYTNRIIFSMVNIRNKSAEAERIGLQQLGTILDACNLPKLSDTDQLIGNTLTVKIDIRQQEGFEPSNNVKSYKKMAGANIPIPKPTNTSIPKAPTPVNNTAPNTSGPVWMKR